MIYTTKVLLFIEITKNLRRLKDAAGFFPSDDIPDLWRYTLLAPT